MELQEAILQRRSIRKYTGEPVALETIEACIRLAQAGPTWKNSQTARYYVVQNPELIEQIRQTSLPAGNALKTAGVAALIVCTYVAKRSGFTRDGQAEDSLGDSWGAYDAGLCHANLLLALTEKGLGSLILGLRDADKLRALLEIPETEIVLSVLAVGHANEAPVAPPRKDLAAICQVR